MTELARFAARRHRLVLLGALLVFLGLAAVGVGAFGALGSGGQTDPNAASSRAASIIDEQFGGTPGLIVMVGAKHGTVDAAAVESVGRQVTAELQHQPFASNVTSYFTTHTAALRSSDGRSALVLARVGNANANTINPHLKPLIASLSKLGGSAATVQSGGQSGATVALTEQIGKDLRLVSIVAVPITIILLYFVFGGALAVLLPLAIAVLAIMGTFAELHVLTFCTNVSTYAIDLNIALGLGLAVDYGLLYVTRYREEVARGLSTEDALARTAATAGRTVLFSGITVALALTALLVFPVYFLRSFGYAGISVVIFAVFGALVVLPALLAALGDRVATPRRIRRATTPAGGVNDADLHVAGTGATRPPRRFWRIIATKVTTHPIVTGLPVVAVLIIVGLPLLNVHFATPDDRALRSTTAAAQVGDALRTRFDATTSSQITVVTTAGQETGSADLTRYSEALSRLPGAEDVQGPTGTYHDGGRTGANPPGAAHTAGDDNYWIIDNRLDPTSSAAADLVREARAVPAPTGTTSLIGGTAATLGDQKHSIGSSLPWAIAILVIASFLMLFLFTGSLLIPLKALVLNARTLFAVVGAMIWVFQGGHLASLLGFTPADTSTTIPPLLFVVAFALSMDYEVFLISRIKELHDNGHNNHDAIIEGMARTGSIVTTAAALLSVTFFAFGLSKISFLQFFGIGTGLAILLDAFIVRGVLVPSVMQLLGERIWWSPRPLAALYRRIGLHESQ
jgi:RND superfamily putative drug exporter